MKTIHKVAGIIIRAGKILLVRKRGTAIFISPGGKKELGETEIDTLAREIKEEIGLAISSAKFFGNFTDKAAFEDSIVNIATYYVSVTGTPTPNSEIEEIKWFTKDEVKKEVAIGSIFKKQVIPSIISKLHN